MRLYSLCTATSKQIVNIVPVYKQASHLLPTSRRSCTRRKLCVKCHSHEFFNCLDHEFLNREISAKAKG